MAIMHSDMKRIAGSLLSLVFVFGVIVFPALHEAHYGLLCSTPGTSHAQNSGGGNGEAPAGHDSDHCPICQLVVTPLIVSSIVLAPVKIISISEIISLPTDLPSIRTFCNPHFARGPPNA